MRSADRLVEARQMATRRDRDCTRDDLYRWWRRTSCVLPPWHSLNGIPLPAKIKEQVAADRQDRRHSTLLNEWRQRQERKRREHRRLHRLIPTHVRRAILVQPCHYCGDLARAVDHVRPVARGGTRMAYNLVAACEYCNDQKFDMTVGEWKSWRLSVGLPWPSEGRFGDLWFLARQQLPHAPAHHAARWIG